MFILLLRQNTVHQAKLGFLQIHHFPIKSFTSSSSPVKDVAEKSFTVSYLMKSCGFSLRDATSASTKVNLKTPENPDSVLKFFRKYGFTNTQISKVMKSRPQFLAANPEKTLLPKLRFFESIGVSAPVLQQIISFDPTSLACSLNTHIIPMCEFIRTMVGNDENVALVLSRCPRIIHSNQHTRLHPNIALLMSQGVPVSSISVLLKRDARCLLEKCDKFEKCVKELIEKGFSPSTMQFVIALQVIGVITESTWNHKMQIYKQWGWGEVDFERAFRSNPFVMRYSEEKITAVMEYLVNEMGFKSESLARIPVVLSLSLEGRIVPRCSVIKILAQKGLLNRELSVGSFLLSSEKIFLDEYVFMYEKDAPVLLRIYEGELRKKVIAPKCLACCGRNDLLVS